MKIKTHEFTLVLDGVDDHTPTLEDSLYEAGCDDALINFRNATVYLDFSRAADSFDAAVQSAIEQVESMPLGAKVISVAPDNLVSTSDIARRLHLKKQAVSLWVKGQRRKKTPFPHPVMKLSDPYPLWRWYEVVKWSIKNNIIQDQDVLHQAIFIEIINSVLAERYIPNKTLRQRLVAKLRATA